MERRLPMSLALLLVACHGTAPAPSTPSPSGWTTPITWEPHTTTQTVPPATGDDTGIGGANGSTHIVNFAGWWLELDIDGEVQMVASSELAVVTTTGEGCIMSHNLMAHYQGSTNWPEAEVGLELHLWSPDPLEVGSEGVMTPEMPQVLLFRIGQDSHSRFLLPAHFEVTALGADALEVVFTGGKVCTETPSAGTVFDTGVSGCAPIATAALRLLPAQSDWPFDATPRCDVVEVPNPYFPYCYAAFPYPDCDTSTTASDTDTDTDTDADTDTDVDADTDSDTDSDTGA